jgi:hypothetical protein
VDIQRILGLTASVVLVGTLGCFPEETADEPEDTRPSCGYRQYYDEYTRQCEDIDQGGGGNGGTGGSGGSGGRAGSGGTGGVAGNGGTGGTGDDVEEYGLQLGMNHYYQVQSQWCWAATITMTANYYGIPVVGCQLASLRAGAPFDSYCCDQYYASQPPCNQPAQPYEMVQVMNFVGLSNQLVGVVSELQLSNEVHAGRPVILGFNNSFAGHVVTVDGLEVTQYGTDFWVYDSAYDSYQIVSYDDLLYYRSSAGTLQWSMTFIGLSR